MLLDPNQSIISSRELKTLQVLESFPLGLNGAAEHSQYGN
jgi:hypothetical protein